MSLLDKVKELVAQKKMTIAELERKLDFSSGSISRWNASTPSVDKVQKVADYFGVTVDYLLDREVDEFEDVQTFFRINMEEVPEEKKEEVIAAMKQYMRFLLRDMED